MCCSRRMNADAELTVIRLSRSVDPKVIGESVRGSTLR